MAADFALESIDFLERMKGRDYKGARKWISDASKRYTDHRGDIGTWSHDAFELILRGEDPGAIRPEIEQHVKHFREFIAAVNPEIVHTEDVAWSDTYGYVGSFDVVMYIWLDEAGNATPDRSGVRHLVLGDWKTSKSIHDEVAMQLAAYTNADRRIDAEGNSYPMPKVDGAVVLHVTEKSWAFKAVKIDDEKVFGTFLNLLESFKRLKAIEGKVIGHTMAGSRRRFVTGAQRRSA